MDQIINYVVYFVSTKSSGGPPNNSPSLITVAIAKLLANGRGRYAMHLIYVVGLHAWIEFADWSVKLRIKEITTPKLANTLDLVNDVVGAGRVDVLLWPLFLHHDFILAELRQAAKGAVVPFATMGNLPTIGPKQMLVFDETSFTQRHSNVHAIVLRTPETPQ